MELEYNLAIKARQKGINGMTRLYFGTHDVKGTYSMLIQWFYKEGVFININLVKQGDLQFVKTDAIVINTDQVLVTTQNQDYYKSLNKTLHQLLNDLPDNTKMRMK